MPGGRNDTNGRKIGDEKERDVDLRVWTERNLIFNETEDSPQSATGTTYDSDTRVEDIIDLENERPQNKNSRRESCEIEDIHETSTKMNKSDQQEGAEIRCNLIWGDN